MTFHVGLWASNLIPEEHQVGSQGIKDATLEVKRTSDSQQLKSLRQTNVVTPTLSTHVLYSEPGTNVGGTVIIAIRGGVVYFFATPR